MSFNPDKNKQVKKKKKKSKPKHSQLLFDKTPVAYSSSQSSLG